MLGDNKDASASRWSAPTTIPKQKKRRIKKQLLNVSEWSPPTHILRCMTASRCGCGRRPSRWPPAPRRSCRGCCGSRATGTRTCWSAGQWRRWTSGPRSTSTSATPWLLIPPEITWCSGRQRFPRAGLLMFLMFLKLLLPSRRSFISLSLQPSLCPPQDVGDRPAEGSLRAGGDVRGPQRRRSSGRPHQRAHVTLLHGALWGGQDQAHAHFQGRLQVSDCGLRV